MRRAEEIERAAKAQRDALCRYWVLWGIEHEDPGCPEDDTCECELVRAVVRAEEQLRGALALPSRTAIDRPVNDCKSYSPPWFKGRWRDWHRGHGCYLDDGQPRSDAGAAEISTGGAP